jgi:NAD(P)H dehydrogenase (quinone)
MSRHPTILVTGASGQLGRGVVQALLGRQAATVIAGSRTPDQLTDLQNLGALTRRVDFDDPASLETAFIGIGRLLIISTDRLDPPGLRQKQHRAALQAALQAGVEHISYTSMPNPREAEAIPFAEDHVDMESALQASGISHTVLRNSWYQENLLAFLPQVVAAGTWFTAAGDGRISYVARQDAAEAAAASVLSTDPSGIHDIAGPDALSVDDIAAVARATLRRPLAVEHVAPERLAFELARLGIAAATVAMLVATDLNQREGRFELAVDRPLSPGSRPRRSLATFFQTHAGLLGGR